jgi:hypothetical protein
MIPSDAEIAAMDDASRYAWLDSLDEAESLIVHTACGYRANMAFCSAVKAWLMREEMSVGDRLQLLESLEPDGR